MRTATGVWNEALAPTLTSRLGKIIVMLYVCKEPYTVGARQVSACTAREREGESGTRQREGMRDGRILTNTKSLAPFKERLAAAETSRNAERTT